MRIAQYMQPDLVLFVDATSRDEVLKQLVRVVFEKNKISNEKEFFEALLSREKIVSTGIGMGVAIPHAKLDTLNHFFITIAVLKKPLAWQSLDGSPVRIVFMIGGPDDKQTEYLQILSHLTQVIKDEEIRKKLLTSTELIDIIELFKTI